MLSVQPGCSRSLIPICPAAGSARHFAVLQLVPHTAAACCLHEGRPHCCTATPAVQAGTAGLSRGSFLCGMCAVQSSPTKWTSPAAAAAFSAERRPSKGVTTKRPSIQKNAAMVHSGNRGCPDGRLATALPSFCGCGPLLLRLAMPLLFPNPACHDFYCRKCQDIGVA